MAGGGELNIIAFEKNPKMVYTCWWSDAWKAAPYFGRGRKVRAPVNYGGG